jgi:phosphatidylserine/phosphatidylglycerophosphate/cardiolipin synthase-like enzyme
MLSSASLRSLAAALRSGALATGISRRAVQQIAGPNCTEILDCLTTLVESGMQPSHIAIAVESIADTRDGAGDPATLFDLVMSGPNVPGYPTGDTSAAMHVLVGEARQEVLLVGYAVHNGRRLFEPLAERMRLVPGLRVWFCLDIPRRLNDTSLASEIVRRYADEFRTKHWPWQPFPELFYDPRSLADVSTFRSSLHAKCVVVDRSAALVTSANFTEAAQQRNIEVGIITRYRPMAERLAGYFEGLCSAGHLVQYPLDF